MPASSPDDLGQGTGSDSRDPQPRQSALLATRRWLLLLLITVGWSLATIVGLLQFARLPLADRVLLVAAAACMALGWTLSRRTAGLWVLLGAPACLVLATVVGGAPGVAWIALPVSASHIAYGLILLTGRRTGLVAIAVVATALVLIWRQGPANVVPGALSIASGWIAVATLVASAFGGWWAWHALTRQARLADEAYTKLTSRTQLELEAQERSQALRRAAITVHETLLSTIRYVLQSPTLDRSGLAAYSRTRPEADPSVQPSDMERAVKEATAARIAADIVRLEPTAVDLPISDDARAALRAAIVECTLNAVLHGGASEVVVSGREEPGRVVVDIVDDGSGPIQGATAGLGWNSVLSEGLGAVGGTWTISRESAATVVTVSLPRQMARSVLGRAGQDDGFDQGRILITAPLAMTAVVGLAFDVLLARESALGWLLVALSLGATTLGVVAVVRQRRSPVLFSLGTVVALALIPWTIILTGPDVGESTVIAAAVNTAGYAIIAVAVWCRWWVWVLGLGIWALGILALVADVPGIVVAPMAVALVNGLIAVPVVVSVSAIGARRAVQAQADLERQRELIRRESLRANTAVLIDQHLSTCVREAERIIEGLSQGAALDPRTRNELASLEGLIRATIQVDPVSSGGFAQAASRLVTSAFDRRQPMQVGTIIASDDPRPLSRLTLRRLDEVISTADSATLRVFTDGECDHLALELGGVLPIDVSIDDPHGAEVTVDEGPGDGSIIVISRTNRERTGAARDSS